MSTMQLDIVTPERKVYSEQVDMVIARAVEGDIGILPNHSPYVSPLAITAIKVKKDGEEFLIAVSGGFIEVRGETVTVLAETAELPSEIDVDRAKAAKQRAEERLADKQREDIDFRRAEIALMKAKTRIQAGRNG